MRLQINFVTATRFLFILQFCCCFCIDRGSSSSWSEWWTYEGISGPEFWGLVNPEWSLCSKGKRQSPIDIDPKQLLYDPHLKHVRMDKHRVSGTMLNTGHDIKLTLDETTAHYVNISGGPLSYHYRVAEISLHFGSTDIVGSEHTIGGSSFPAEIHIVGYNVELYGNMTQAFYASNGLACVSLLAQVGHTSNTELESLTQQLKHIKYKGQQVRVRHLSITDLLPPTDDYLTYEGSMTQPGCHETVTWIIMNKPIYVTAEQLSAMRDVMQGDQTNPKFPMNNNFRPTLPLHQRSVRTNIVLKSQNSDCAVEKNVFYQANVLERS
jgi:carbonic anhydrase